MESERDAEDQPVFRLHAIEPERAGSPIVLGGIREAKRLIQDLQAVVRFAEGKHEL